jgi:hypothetical protein
MGTNKKSEPRVTRATPADQDAKEVEGEGSYTATHNYDEGVERSVQRGDTASLAEEAKQALEGEEGDALREAERKGRNAQIPSSDRKS